MAVPVLATTLVDASRPTGIVPYGLFSVGPVLPLTRATAVEWDNRVCVDVHETISECFTGIETSPTAKTLVGGQNWQLVTPFTLYVASDCPPDPNDDTDARARDRMVAGEQFGVEAHFHAEILSDLPTSVGAALSPLRAVGRLEQALAAAYGVPGVIHMSREMYTIISGLDVQHVGGTLRTELGTLIAAGGGYPFETSMYGTGPLRIFRSEMEVVNALDYTNNRDIFLTERSYVVAADLCDDVFVVTGITPIS